jgi:hypothetical protein
MGIAGVDPMRPSARRSCLCAIIRECTFALKTSPNRCLCGCTKSAVAPIEE